MKCNCTVEQLCDGMANPTCPFHRDGRHTQTHDDHMYRAETTTETYGLSFHDQCVIAAMQALIPAMEQANDGRYGISHYAAVRAFDYADAMLAERERRAAMRGMEKMGFERVKEGE